MKRFLFICSCICAALLASNRTEAGVIPSGVQNDVPYSTVINDWGWTEVYRGDYNDTVSIASLFAGVTGDYVMLAAIKDGSTTFDILAAALRTEVQTYTPLNTPHASNGAVWYYNAYSIGFAGAGDSILQWSADVNGTPWYGNGVDENDRLSWHAATYTFGQTPNLPPEYIFSGWRSGSQTDKNVYDGTWNRVILTANAAPTVTPEPASLAIWGLGAAACAFAGYRRKRAARSLTSPANSA